MIATPIIVTTTAAAKTYVSARSVITIGAALVIPSAIALKVIIKGEL